MPKETKSLRRRFLKQVGAAAAAVTLAGCASGGSQANKSGNSGGGSQANKSGNSSGGESVNGKNSFTAIAGKNLRSLDPHKVSDDLTQVVGLSLYDPMMRVDSNGKPVNHLVTDWKTENNGKRWTFTLRKDVTFHSGNKLTADDVVYSANRWLALGYGYASFWSSFVSQGNVKTRNDSTVEFNLKKTFGPFIASLVMFKVVDSKIVKQHEKPGSHGDHGDYGVAYLSGNNDAGSGPYALKKYSKGDQISFEQYGKYWRGWKGNHFTSPSIQFIQEESTTRQMMTGGEADMTDQYLSPEAYQSLDKSDKVSVKTKPSNQIYEIMMNCQKKPLDDINVRKAIALSYNYQTALNKAWDGAQPCPGPVPVTMAGHDDSIKPYKRNLKAAKQALDKSRYSLDEINAIELEVSWISSVDLERRLALLLQQNLKEIGITNVNITGRPWTSWTGLVSSPKKTPHFSSFYHSADFPTPDNFTYKKYHPSASGTIVSASWFNSPKVFKQAGVPQLPQVLEKARTTVNRKKRIKKYKEAQRLIVKGYPSIFIANPPYQLAMNNQIENWKFYGGVLGFPRQIYPLTAKQ